MLLQYTIPAEQPTAVQLKTILNHVERHKSFVYQEARWVDPATKTAIEIPIQPRANGRAICSGCGQPAPGYDRLAERRFGPPCGRCPVPLWQIAVFFVYAMRRVQCPTCGVKVEQVPWCDGKNQLTTTYRWFLAGWARRLSWKGVAVAFARDVAERVLLGKTRGFLGLGASRPGGRRVDRRRRSAVAEGAQVPHTGVPDRRGLEAAVRDWPGSDGQDLFAVLPDARRRTFRPTEVCVQRHVAGLFDSDRQEGLTGDSRARPLSHHAEDDGHTP